MEPLLAVHDRACDSSVWLLLRLALAIDSWRRAVRKRALALRGSLRRLLRRWLKHRGLETPFVARRLWNRTPNSVEEKLVGLHVEYPHLGAGQLAALAARVLGFRGVRETVRRILLRRHSLVVEIEEARRPARRRIRTNRARELWGLDMTLVWILGFWPAWLLGIVDYHGSRLVALERLRWPTSAEVVRVLSAVFAKNDEPARVLTDNGGAFISHTTSAFLEGAGVHHSRIRPGHAWTNGRIERLFRTFKSTVFTFIWILASPRQVDEYCNNFLRYYRDRPHSAYGGRTPDEVYFGRKPQMTPLGEATYFDSHLRWFRFG